jgi:transposase
MGWSAFPNVIQRCLRRIEESSMAWTKADRLVYKPPAGGYATDLTDAEWSSLEPLLPVSRTSWLMKYSFRIFINAILYQVRAGVQWRLLPKDFPPFTTVQHWFYKWRDSGVLDQILCLLVQDLREKLGREASPSAVVVDSQSAKSTQTGGERGFDAGKKINGIKRHMATDTLGLPIIVQITCADIQDRDQLAPVLDEVHRRCPWVKVAFVDAGYNGDEAQRAAFEASKIHPVVVKRTDKHVKGFVVIPKRWVVERTFGWLNLARRLAKNYEKTMESAKAWLQIALIAILLRRNSRMEILTQA